MERCADCLFWTPENHKRGICRSPTERRVVAKHGGSYPTAFSFGRCREFTPKGTPTHEG